MSVRAARIPEDFGPVAALLTASSPEWPVTAELLRYEHEHRDPARLFCERVADRGGPVEGVLGLDADPAEAGAYWATLKVRPESRRAGVGSALYAELLGLLAERQGRRVRTMLTATETGGLHFLAARGWQETWRRHEFRLDTAAALPELPELGGLRLERLDALESDPRRNACLHELDWAISQDVPMGLTPSRTPLDLWVRQRLEDPVTSLGLSFALLDDARTDPLTGPYVGYTTLRQNPGFHVIGMTGVLPAYRGRGLARALKLASMYALREAGGGSIRTFNDPPNAAMIAMNRALGFVRWPDHLRYELRLEGA